MAEFVHLHNHSEFSLLDGLSRIDAMVEAVKKLGMHAIAITDHGNLYGALKFYKACREQEIKPIIGCEMYLAKRSRLDRDAKADSNYNHVILLAKNYKGYVNLIKLVSIAHLEGYYYKPRIDLETLEKYHEGLIATSACLNGYFAKEILEGNMNEAEAKAQKMFEIFGQDHYFLELQLHPKIADQKTLNEGLVTISKKLGIPIVATNDNHYINREDAEAHDILLAIQTQTTVLDANRPLKMIDSPDFYIKTPKEMKEMFWEHKDAITNTLKISEMCEDYEIPMGKWIMPNFDVPDGLTPDDYIKKKVDEGLKVRYGKITDEIAKRRDYELGIILKKGYETYILIVADFVNWAKDNGIAVGPGRGSNAGSIVSYALKISDVDPLFFKLPFERFLNPMRPSPPDIDLDFADDRRDEVIQYVTEKYGKEKVAQIITFGTMEARQSIRDAGRALGMPYAGPDRIAKMIPSGAQGFPVHIDDALRLNQDLNRAYQTESETKKLIDIAKKLEGVARHASVHAAGVVIADQDLTEYTPLQKDPNGEKNVTQYDMYTVGEDGVGLLKIDFLGLRNLTIIQESLRFIKENQGITLDFSNVDLGDKKTFELLASGETTGIFQLESAGMRRYIKDLRPTTIFDLQAMVALYRPGPMANIPEFIRRKNNPEYITYPDERLQDILKESYGIITFQDDLLLTAIKVAGYSWLEADKLRKAVGKKIPVEMKKQHEKFVSGCVKNGMTRGNAELLWQSFEPFAGYGFGKAHAACYATIAFRTAFLKAHFPVEFMTAVLTAETRATSGPTRNEKISKAIAECRRLNVEVLPPSVNKSISEFSIEDKTKIRFGLSAVKNVGGAAIQTILEARALQTFTSFYDFCKRVDSSKVNKKTLESLIKAGAMDEFGKRSALLSSMPEIVTELNKKNKQSLTNQTGLFDDFESTVENEKYVIADDIEEFTEKEKLTFERELLGFFLTNHPLHEEIHLVRQYSSHEIEELHETKEGQRIKVGGLITTVKTIITKKSNQEMAFITIENHLGSSIECVVFPKTFESLKMLLIRDSIVMVNGKIDFKDDRPVIIVDTISRLRN